MSFPKDFIWGAASAAYQIEGAAFSDGKGPSIWDRFSHTPGAVFNGQTGDIAADAYHRFEEDLDLMQKLGIRNYRFSISWPRVLPDGTYGPEGSASVGKINPAGLDYYDRVTDGCLSRGITPWVTLYHWDLPQALQDRGGWRNRETAFHFARYAALIASHFRGRVKNYITVNEPQCAIGLGMGLGIHAPGLRLDHEDLFLCWHHMLLAHGLAVREIRKAAPESTVALSSTGGLAYTEHHLEKTPEALAEASFLTPENSDPIPFFNHQWVLDPTILGRYPDDPAHPWADEAKKIPPEDLAILSEPVDYIGINIYNGHEMVCSEEGVWKTAEKYPGYPRTALKWPVTPEVIYWGPRLLYERYGLPVCILENGQACNDRIFLDGKVHDPDRIDFLHRYLKELKALCESGVPVLGYFQWSFTDNFEWHTGYDERFGLVYIDYQTQQRIPKDSAFWYSDVARTNGAGI